MSSPYIVGLDLGKAQDFTALAILEVGASTTPCQLRHLARFPLGTPYTEIAASVKRLLESPPLVRYSDTGTTTSRATLVVDATGVGAAVIEVFEQAGLRPVKVLIHGGAQMSRRGAAEYHVPKRDLIAGLLVAFQERRLLIADGMPEGQTFVQELMTVDYRMTPSANETYTHREGTHDDLVLAVALAHWYAVGRYARRSSGMVVLTGNGLA